jgi:hypothetical protein
MCHLAVPRWARIPILGGLRCGDFGRRWSIIRVFVAFEDQYRTYREAIGTVIGSLRPQVAVTTTNLKDLEGELADLEPRVVICSRDKPANLPPGIPWVYVYLEVGPAPQPTLATLLEAIDRAEKPSPPREEGAVVPRGGALSTSAGNGP